ncbi:MAG: sigma-70 family RNA polymerase sigma factor [Phycisphaerales bacterium]|nr:MAG: sigma-70 family RNA polymerase sigma factor [Phycisphaerales bacterium]
MASIDAMTDEDVRRAASGSPHDAERLMQLVTPQVSRMVAARLSPRSNQWHAAEEIVQESLLALTQGLSRLERQDAAGLRAFLSRIVENKVADRLRKQQRKPGAITGGHASLQDAVGRLTQTGRFEHVLQASGVSPRTAAAEAEQVEQMLTALGRLKDEHRRVITFAFFDQLKTAEIAEQMQISRPAASMLLIRAVDALRREMADSDTAPPAEEEHGP